VPPSSRGAWWCCLRAAEHGGAGSEQRSTAMTPPTRGARWCRLRAAEHGGAGSEQGSTAVTPSSCGTRRCRRSDRQARTPSRAARRAHDRLAVRVAGLHPGRGICASSSGVGTGFGQIAFAVMPRPALSHRPAACSPGNRFHRRRMAPGCRASGAYRGRPERDPSPGSRGNGSCERPGARARAAQVPSGATDRLARRAKAAGTGQPELTRPDRKAPPTAASTCMSGCRAPGPRQAAR
jgi:hypothetical protein